MRQPGREISPQLRNVISNRMRDLGLSPTDLIKRTGLSQPGLAPLYAGERRKYQRRLTTPVCRALGWTPDSIQRILDGGEPQVLPTPPADEIADLQRQVEALALAVRELLSIAGLDAEAWLRGPLAAGEDAQ